LGFEIGDEEKGEEEGFLDLVLAFLQNLCEGHFTEMKVSTLRAWE